MIISSPVFSTYAKYVDKQKLERGMTVIRNICAKYDCDYHNYTRDTRFDIRDYADNDHFNFVGANKYSRIINEEIVETHCKKIKL